jgi:hypothetical protein
MFNDLNASSGSTLGHYCIVIGSNANHMRSSDEGPTETCKDLYNMVRKEDSNNCAK